MNENEPLSQTNKFLIRSAQIQVMRLYNKSTKNDPIIFSTSEITSPVVVLSLQPLLELPETTAKHNKDGAVMAHSHKGE